VAVADERVIRDAVHGGSRWIAGWGVGGIRTFRVPASPERNLACGADRATSDGGISTLGWRPDRGVRDRGG
jgi:hypothetical protein